MVLLFSPGRAGAEARTEIKAQREANESPQKTGFLQDKEMVITKIYDFPDKIKLTTTFPKKKALDGIWLHETNIFKRWLKEKGYTWPVSSIAQQNLVAKFLGEGLESAHYRKGI